jgi:hypothetical protein
MRIKTALGYSAIVTLVSVTSAFAQQTPTLGSQDEAVVERTVPADRYGYGDRDRVSERGYVLSEDTNTGYERSDTLRPLGRILLLGVGF